MILVQPFSSLNTIVTICLNDKPSDGNYLCLQEVEIEPTAFFNLLLMSQSENRLLR